MVGEQTTPSTPERVEFARKGAREGGNCSCQRAGLKCSALCKVCQGKTCLNTPPLDMADESDEEDDVDHPLSLDPTTQESPEYQEEPSDESGPSKRTRLSR